MQSGEARIDVDSELQCAFLKALGTRYNRVRVQACRTWEDRSLPENIEGSVNRDLGADVSLLAQVNPNR